MSDSRTSLAPRETVALEDGAAVTCVWAVPPGFRPRLTPTVVLGHGAGAGMDSPFMAFFHQGIAAHGMLAVKFNFPYREAGRRAPDRQPVLERTWRAVLAAVRGSARYPPGPVFIGGKSMGGRIASHLAAAGEDVTGVVLLGYPLHPPGRSDRLRGEHLRSIRAPMLFVQGTRDPLCELDRLRAVIGETAGPVDLHVVDGGDHSLEPPARSGRSREDTWGEALEVVARWVLAHAPSGRTR